MSLFGNPERHADNPPETWRVVKVADRNWQLQTKDGGVLESGRKTRREAEELLTTGFYVDLYDKERRWYAGEPVAQWRPYAEIVAEQAAREARRSA